VILDYHSPISLAIATTNAILTSLEDTTPPPNPLEPTHHYPRGREYILSIANDLQNILGDAMDLATSTFSQKSITPDKGHALPHHL
jgi:hypothetical protein